MLVRGMCGIPGGRKRREYTTHLEMRVAVGDGPREALTSLTPSLFCTCTSEMEGKSETDRKEGKHVVKHIHWSRW